ncbi:3-phosphoshikimate 1-carboxyvinyltransferase [Brevibacterium spongiae]|uniref:3-phosphoshikimate 1-carboxyvinyltransferase n=1 Tax=Brevibacterium spongiae TaxID=2909672 RepID=A0ABY5SX05_9MICO|nr:3-phosphoshikimate 1-carboxyvinyltransferase [Brevibacterium spongiae]UVI37621.1 3-phosphoshikimate 1-carboxyvinyltransferase [Brevibacterium spongiae]
MTGDWQPPVAGSGVSASVSVPGSKSLTNRYLILAALARSGSDLKGWLRSRDTLLMIEALRRLGAVIDEDGDLLHIEPVSLPGTATAADSPTAAEDLPPTAIDCGLAGTVMRFIPPVAALTGREVVLDGDEQARVRPMSVTVESLRRLGGQVTSADGMLPVTVHASSQLRGGHLEIDASASSQFVSGLLLAGAVMPLGLELVNTGATVPSRTHVDMTLEVLRDAGVDVSEPEPERWIVEPGQPRGLDVQVEPDLSNAAAFAAAAIAAGGTVTIADWPAHTTQAGDGFRDIAEAFGAQVVLDRQGLHVTGPEVISAVDLDLSAVGELTPVVSALAALADGTSQLRGIGHLRGHETDRLAALTREYTGIGVDVIEHSDALTITGTSDLRPALWHTYRDHRMVMAGAILALRNDGMVIEDAGTVAKTLPEFTHLWEAMLTPGA